MGSNLCLLMAWWQLLPLRSGPQWWHLVPVSGTPPGFEALAVASQLAFSLWDCQLQSHLVPPLALLLAWHTLVVARHTFLWGQEAHSPCLPHLWHSRKWVPGICELGEWGVLAATDSCLSGRPRLFPGLPQLCCASPSEYLHSSQPQFSPWGLSPEALILSTQPPSCHGGCASCFLAGKCWLGTSLWWILCFAFWAPIAVLPLRVWSSPPSPPMLGCPNVQKLFVLHGSLPGCRSLFQTPLSLFIFIFCPTSFWGDWLAFLEVWGLLPAFRRCSVWVVSCAHVFLIHLWGGRWSPRLPPLPSWKFHT